MRLWPRESPEADFCFHGFRHGNFALMAVARALFRPSKNPSSDQEAAWKCAKPKLFEVVRPRNTAYVRVSCRLQAQLCTSNKQDAAACARNRMLGPIIWLRWQESGQGE